MRNLTVYATKNKNQVTMNIIIIIINDVSEEARKLPIQQIHRECFNYNC